MENPELAHFVSDDTFMYRNIAYYTIGILAKHKVTKEELDEAEKNIQRLKALCKFPETNSVNASN